MRLLLAATCSAGVAVLSASPATAGAPSPGVPSDAAIAQYVEVVPSVSGLVPVGERADATTLPPAVRAKIEQTAGADAPLLIDITADSRFGARPVARANPAAGGSTKRATPAQVGTPHAVPRRPAELATIVPGPLAAAASTAGSGGFLLVGLLLAAITAAGIAGTVLRR
jgi:hypothetical protein